jgi:hypothetical protein
MRASALPLLAALAVFSVPTIEAGDDSAENLLDAAIRNPGTWSQMCDIQFVKKRTPLPLYGLLLDSEFQFLPATLGGLRARRDEVVPLLVRRLEALDLSKRPVSTPSKLGADDETIETTGLDPHHLSQLLLNIVIDLNATDCLPSLLRLESELSRRLEANNADPKANPVPEFQLEAGFVAGTFEEIGEREPTPEEAAAAVAKHLRASAIIVQRDLLATMLALLRQERYAPLLDSGIEKQFAAAIRKQAATENFAAIKSAADIPVDDADYIAIDPIVKVPCYPGGRNTEIAYTPEVRQQVLDWTRAFVKMPNASHLGAKGMSPRPYVR